jgi:hypothetical protein
MSIGYTDAVGRWVLDGTADGIPLSPEEKQQLAMLTSKYLEDRDAPNGERQKG